MPKKAPLPVISVGNIAFGGTEKTPLVIDLISCLARHGFKPALVSRGYKGKWEKSGGILSDGKNIFGTWKDSGDEPYMVAQNFPKAGIFIGKNRLLSCRKAKQLGFEIAVLDDGFQHRRLHRDLDIVLYDPDEKIALREPFSSLKRADILLVKRGTSSQRKSKIEKRFPETEALEYSVQNRGFFGLGQKEKKGSEDLRGKKVIAFCGIARPRRFLARLQEEGLQPLSFLEFPDHHPYPPSSIERITEEYTRLAAEAIITTEKDAVKLVHDKKLEELPVYYLKIGLEVEERFYLRIISLLQNRV